MIPIFCRLKNDLAQVLLKDLPTSDLRNLLIFLYKNLLTVITKIGVALEACE